MLNTMRTILKIFVQVFLFILIVSSCKENQVPDKSDSKIRVKTTVVKQREMAFPIHSSGKLALKEEIKLSFKIGGIINKIHTEEGAKVKKGTLLAELNLTEIQARVNQASLGLKKAERDHEHDRPSEWNEPAAISGSAEERWSLL